MKTSTLASLDASNVVKDGSVIYAVSGADPLLKTKIHTVVGNRAVNLSHAKAIAKDMLKHNGTWWKHFEPIVININTWTIVNGQHRWYAAANCMTPQDRSKVCLFIRFLDLSADDERELILGSNCNNKNWTVGDFIESNRAQPNAARELVEYEKFAYAHASLLLKKPKKGNFMKNINTALASAVLWGYTPKGLKSNKFAASERLGKNELKKAEDVHDELVQVLDALKSRGLAPKGLWVTRLAEAWHKMRDNPTCSQQIKAIGMNGVVKNINLQPLPAGSATSEATWESWIASIL